MWISLCLKILFNGIEMNQGNENSTQKIDDNF